MVSELLPRQAKQHLFSLLDEGARAGELVRVVPSLLLGRGHPACGLVATVAWRFRGGCACLVRSPAVERRGVRAVERRWLAGLVVCWCCSCWSAQWELGRRRRMKALGAGSAGSVSSCHGQGRRAEQRHDARVWPLHVWSVMLIRGVRSNGSRRKAQGSSLHDGSVRLSF